MNPLNIAVLAAALAVASPAAPALAAKARNAAAPETADQTLGMAIMSATVAADGSLVRGSGAVSSFKSAPYNPGDYFVRFARDVRDCTYVASVGGPTSPAVYTANAAASAAGTTPQLSESVRIQTSADNGTVADYPFHLIVFCPR